MLGMQLLPKEAGRVRIAAGFKNGLGNALIATCAWQALAKIAGQPIDLILDDDWRTQARESIIQMASKLPFICRIVGYPSGFKREDYDYVYMSQHSNFTSALYQSIYGNTAIKAPSLPVWAETYEHERDYYLFEIASQLKAQPPICKQWTPIADEFPYPLPEGPIICLANGFKRSMDGNHIWARKQWPYFGELAIDLLHYYPEITIAFLGGSQDKIPDYLEKFPSNEEESSLGIHSRIMDFNGRLNVLETGWLINRSVLTISNDSFVMHAVDALKKPGIALWGSTLVSKNGPLNGTVEVIRSPMECAPCQGSISFVRCDEPSLCMAAIEPGLVFACVRKFLQQKSL